MLKDLMPTLTGEKVTQLTEVQIESCRFTYIYLSGIIKVDKLVRHNLNPCTVVIK